MSDRIKVDLPYSEGWPPRELPSLAYVRLDVPGYSRFRGEIVRLTLARRRAWLRIVSAPPMVKQTPGETKPLRWTGVRWAREA